MASMDLPDAAEMWSAKFILSMFLQRFRHLRTANGALGNNDRNAPSDPTDSTGSLHSEVIYTANSIKILMFMMSF